MVTGLGFCGHDHDHGSTHEVCTSDVMHMEECDADSSLPVHTHNHKDDTEKEKRCHCSCLGGFTADLNPIIHIVVHRLTILPAEIMDIYRYVYTPLIYHPPIGMIQSLPQEACIHLI